MTKLKKFNFFSSFLACFLALTPVQKNLYALDLTIDLPLSAGKTPNSFIPPIAVEKKVVRTTVSNAIPEPPPILLKSRLTPIKDIQFPELSCLKDNINFWEKVYSDLDTNEGVVHDRNDLGRIYAIITLPRGEKSKNAFLKKEKKLLEKKIVSLAKKIRSKSPLDKNEEILSKLFPKKDLSYKLLIEAASNVRIQTGLKSQFSAGIRRSLNYRSAVFPIVKKSGLPMDLVYLPHVESSYNSRAGSKVGALGLWQLMPSTMRNLEGRQAVMKRTDPTISTKAAMKLLKINYEKTGSWPLALTAYNHGANGVLRAIQKTKSHDLCTIIERYDSPSFKFASSNFYAQFLAARRVASERYKIIARNENTNELKNLLTATGGPLRSICARPTAE